MTQFKTDVYDAMVTRAMRHEQEPAMLRPARPALRRPPLFVPAMGLIAACLMLLFVMPSAPPPTPIDIAQINEISDNITYNMIDDLAGA